MRGRLAVAFALLLTGLPAAVRSVGADQLTLPQAIAEALANGDRVLDERDSAEQAELALRLARNAFTPKLTPNMLGSFGQTDVNSQTYRLDLTQRLTSGTEFRVSAGTATAQIPGLPGISNGDLHYYNADTTLTVTQPLLRGAGRAVARRPLTSAEFHRDDLAMQQRLTEQRVAIDVAAAYYRIIAQRALVDASRKSLDRARRLRDASEARLDAGLVSQLDVLRAQQLVTQAQAQVFDAESAVEEARDALTYLLGRDRDATLEVEAEIPRPDRTPIDVGAAVTTALENRLDIRRAQANVEDADRQIAFVANERLPQVDVNVALTRRLTADSFTGSFGVDRFRFATFFTVSMPVDRTQQSVNVQNALIERKRRERDLSLVRRRIADDVARAVREHDRALRMLTTAESTVQLAQREVDVAQLRFERGLSNNLDLVTAEGNLLAAEGRRVQALAEAAVNGLSYQAVLGHFNPRREFNVESN